MIKFEKLRIYPRFLLSLTVRVVAAIIVGVILLSLVYMIPAERMEANVAKSAERLSKEGTAAALYSWCTSTLANWTDSLMILDAAYQNDDQSLIEQAMMVHRYTSTESPHESLVNQYVYHTGEPVRGAYPRYWHGYLLWLKPAMCFMSYQPLRYVNGAIQNSLLLFLVFLMFRKKMTAYILPVLTAAGMLMPVLLAKSMQCSSCYYLMLFGLLAVVAFKEQLLRKEAYIFLYIGIGVAYFDFLTYPIATIGVPAALCFAIHSGPSLKDDICRLFRICFCWCFGYGMMWAGKWVVGSLLTGTNVFDSAFNAATYRLRNDNLGLLGVTEDTALSYTFQRNWEAFWRTPVTYFFCGAVLVLLAVYLFRVIRNKSNLKALWGSAVLAVIAFMPLVWYAVLINHSAIHISITNKALVVIPFAVLCICVKLVQSTNPPKKNLKS